MFSDSELRKYAETLWWGLTTARTAPFKDGDYVLLRYDQDALPLAEVMFELLLEKGVVPVPRMNMPVRMEKGFYTLGSIPQIEAVTPGDKELFENLNGLVSLIAPASLTHLKDVDPTRIGKAAVARKYLRDILDVREQTGDFGWTLCMCPTPALAESAGLSLEEYAEQIKKACYLDDDDPTARWMEVFEKAEVVKKWLNGLNVERFHVQSDNVDLLVDPGKDRRWLGVSGHNVPSFELFLSPDWRGTEGVYFADQPSFRSGNYVKGVRLEFKDGVAVKVDAEEGAEFVKKQLDMDEGASRLGEFSLTDRRFSKIDKFMANTLFDENFGGEQGNCHVAVGASYADTYAGDQSSFDKAKRAELGFNDSALHWDLVNTEQKRVTAKLKGGGEVVIYDNGEFQHDK